MPMMCLGDINFDKFLRMENIMGNKRLPIRLKSGNSLYIYTFAALVGIINSLFFTNAIISNAFVVIEVIVLTCLFISRRYIDYFGMYVLFCGLSIEYGQLVEDGVFYGFKNTRILGVNLGILALLPMFIVSVKYLPKLPKNKFGNFFKYFIFLQVSAALTGIILILFNENGVRSFTGILGKYIGNLYTMSVQSVMIAFIFLMFINRSSDIGRIEKYFLGLLYGVVFSLIASFLFGTQGYYGGAHTLVVSNNVRWLPLMLLLPIYPKYKGKLSIWILGCVGAILVLMYNATGKMVILYAVIPGVFLYLNLRRRQYRSALFVILLIPAFIILVCIGASYISERSVLFRNKLNQALSLIAYFLGRIGSSSVLDSPQVRIYELINILKEYAEKPWLMIWGKGFMGTVKNYAGISYAAGTYTQEEWSLGLFYRLHESINKLFLANGLVGLGFLFVQIKNGIKSIAKTPWASIGLYWLLISYGHSITMTAFGFSCLVYSIIQADGQKGRRCCPDKRSSDSNTVISEANIKLPENR